MHFADKTDLVIAVVTEREPHFAKVLELHGKAGEASVETISQGRSPCRRRPSRGRPLARS